MNVQASEKVRPLLWFNDQAEEAAKFYISIFKDGEITGITRYNNAASNASGRPAGSVMTVAFRIRGLHLIALNGGPAFRFSEVVSLFVTCDSQEEIDYFWEKLTAGGHPSDCGWLKDKFGLSWQVVPAILPHLLTGDDKAKCERAMVALMQMKKLDIAALQRAHAGHA